RDGWLRQSGRHFVYVPWLSCRQPRFIAFDRPEIKRPMVAPIGLTPWRGCEIGPAAVLSFASGSAPC
ncbi:MAG TPA: hypothetical protein VIE35_17935, partial [Dongiaceae bacterium]